VSDPAGLDPRDWEAYAALLRRAADDMVAHVRDIRDAPVWQPPDEAAHRLLADPALPFDGIGDDAVYADFLAHVLPYPTGNLHPRFWGWVMGTGVPSASIAALCASFMNVNNGGFEQAATLVERQVLRWLGTLLLDAPEASGVLTAGASVANLVALTAGVHARAGFDVRAEGLMAAPAPLAVYASVETHSWITRAMSVIGLGERALRRIPAGPSHAVDVDALRAQLAADRDAGVRPTVIIGTAGTVNTGAIDDLAALADVAAEHDCWFHVDGAFGALARLAPSLAPRLAGIERADSLAFDLHKWGYLPVGTGGVLVRDAGAHLGPFAARAAYLDPTARGPMTSGVTFGDRGLDLSRSFNALQAWFVFRSHGIRAIGDSIAANVAQAQRVARHVEEAPHLELLAPVPLNVVTFRWRGRDAALPDAARDAITAELLLRIQEQGLAMPSGTRVRGRYGIRLAITNHRTREADLALFLDAVDRIGAEVEAERGAALTSPTGA
jgi:glutamate/tyrosine decarboxylase-like PLP-dependent enzyme